jgi:hypothetical protein
MNNLTQKIPTLFFLVASQLAHAQWTNSGFNYTTDRIAIGTSGWSGKRLYVTGNDADHVAFLENTNSGGFGMVLKAPNDPLRIVPASGSGDYLFVVNGDGKVGIGTSTPSAKLNVYNAGLGTQVIFGNPSTGSGGFTSLLAGTSADTNGYGYLQVIKSSGSSLGDLILNPSGAANVGIGTTTPKSKLEVNGDIQISNPSTNIQFAQSGWGNSHAILFNAYKSNPQVNGNLADPGNVKYSNDVGSYGSGAGMIHFLANGGRMDFYLTDVSNGATNSVNWPTPALSLTRGGNVGIGSYSPDAKLAVKGQVHASEVKVDLNVPGPDYVFEKNYKLSSLEEIKNYIDQNKHLPEVPSAKEMEKNGVQLGEMNMLLLKKIEELTLYQIQSVERIQMLENEIKKLKAKDHE